MILSAEAAEIIAYLKTAHGKFVSLAEISRKAGGRRRFEELPNWAKNLMPLMMDAGIVEVNARGHYRVQTPDQPPPQPQHHPHAKPASSTAHKPRGKVLGDDYFPASDGPRVVAGDYFPTSD